MRGASVCARAITAPQRNHHDVTSSPADNQDAGRRADVRDWLRLFPGRPQAGWPSSLSSSRIRRDLRVIGEHPEHLRPDWISLAIVFVACWVGRGALVLSRCARTQLDHDHPARSSARPTRSGRYRRVGRSRPELLLPRHRAAENRLRRYPAATRRQCDPRSEGRRRPGSRTDTNTHRRRMPAFMKTSGRPNSKTDPDARVHHSLRGVHTAHAAYDVDRPPRRGGHGLCPISRRRNRRLHDPFDDARFPRRQPLRRIFPL